MANQATIEVGPADAGMRVDHLLGDDPRIGSRNVAQRLIAAGAVTVDGARVSKSTQLHAGQTIQVELGEDDSTNAEPQLPAVPFEVVYEDEHLLVVDKPAGLVVHPAAVHPTGTLAQALAGRAAGGEAGRLGIVHRLDKDTSGLLVVAKSDAVLRALQGALAAREIRRRYAALVRGRPASATGTIDAPLGRDRHDRKKMALTGGGGRNAVTHFEVAEGLADATLLRLTLESGRTHQIRVHLAGIGLPVCGDPQYGVPGMFGLSRQFLHASQLAFTHPQTGQELEFESPLPGDLAAALELARAQSTR